MDEPTEEGAEVCEKCKKVDCICRETYEEMKDDRF